MANQRGCEDLARVGGSWEKLGRDHCLGLEKGEAELGEMRTGNVNPAGVWRIGVISTIG